jgi:hypothetical protein
VKERLVRKKDVKLKFSGGQLIAGVSFSSSAFSESTADTTGGGKRVSQNSTFTSGNGIDRRNCRWEDGFPCG